MIAGSYAEHAPVVHIVGAPAKDAQVARRLVHHFLGDGDLSISSGSHARSPARKLICSSAATREIDRVLSESREQKRPGYLLIATDAARFPTEPPTAPLPRYIGGTSPARCRCSSTTQPNSSATTS